MAITYKLVEANTNKEIDLAYNSSTNPNWLINTGSPSMASPVTPKFHRPDDASPEIIRLIADIRPMQFSMIVQGDDNDPDDLLNNIAALARWVDGPDQQAARYHTQGDVNKIELHVKINGATNITKIPVIYGNVSSFDSLFTEFGAANTAAYGATVQLYLAPHGEGAPITLRNDLPSSPHFLEDSNADGIADGWLAVGTPTTGISVARYLIGGKSQQITTNSSSNQGIRSGLVTASSSSTAVAYIWLQGLTSGGLFGDTVTINLTDGSDVSIQSKTFNPTTPTGYDKSYVDSTGTWYRYVVSGTNVNANFRLYITRTAALATKISTFVADAAYLQTGTTTAPDAWCSTSAIYNRNDPVTANPERINYVDVAFIPGDSDAVVDLLVEPTSTTGTKNTLAVSRLSDSIVSAVDVGHWQDSASMLLSLFVSGSQSSPSDANRAGGSYLRYTAAASPADGQLEIYPAVGSDNYLKFFSVPHRVFLIARSSNAGTAFEWIEGPGIIKVLGEAVSFNAANTWEMLDIGYVLPIDRATYDNFGGSAVSALLINITPGAGSATTDIDAALILPAVEDGLIFVTSTTSSADLRILGSYKQVITDSAFSAAPGAAGSLWEIPPGNKISRYVFTRLNNTTQVHDLTDALTITFTITPRTRHLLGTS